MDDIQGLVLKPFYDIVEGAETALKNAQAAGLVEPMQKAAQSLVKDGRRAIARVEPLCHRHYAHYSTNFVTALKANEPIRDLIAPLEDVLFDFDDYVEVKGFDAARFAKAQGLVRTAALRISDILKRMHLEAPPVEDELSALSLSRKPSLAGHSQTSEHPSTPLSPWFRGLFSDEDVGRDGRSMGVAGDTGAPSPRRASFRPLTISAIPESDEAPEEPMSATSAGPVPEWWVPQPDGRHMLGNDTSVAREMESPGQFRFQSAPVEPEPDPDPWKAEVSVTSDTPSMGAESYWERRRRVSSTREGSYDTSPVLPDAEYVPAARWFGKWTKV